MIGSVVEIGLSDTIGKILHQSGRGIHAESIQSLVWRGVVIRGALLGISQRSDRGSGWGVEGNGRLPACRGGEVVVVADHYEGGGGKRDGEGVSIDAGR